MQPINTGALIDNRLDEEKEKDWLHEELAAGLGDFVWEERPIRDRYYFAYDQGTSLSCVAGGIAIMREHFARNKGLAYVPSRKDIYIRRANKPGGGMMMHDAFNIGIKGMASEGLVESQRLSETPMNTQYPITPDILHERAKNAFDSWVSIKLFNDIDTIASVARHTPVMCFWFFDNNNQYQEWWNQIPRIVNGDLGLYDKNSAHHQVCIVDAVLIDGKKYLVGQDTAGVGMGTGSDRNLRLISEEMVTRRLYAAGYGIDKPETPTVPKPLYRFNRHLKVGMSGGDVKALQDILRYEGCIDLPASTGYFGGITLRGVKNLQLKHRAEILTPAGLSLPTGYMGTYTIKYLNKTYGN